VIQVVKKTLKRWWTEWLRSALLIVLVITSFRSAVADWNDVPTGSMKPTIFEGDRIVVNKLAYDLKIPFTTLRLVSWANPLRGDIVVLYSPVDGKRLVKRVVGVPGDIVSMREDRLIVNDVVVSYAPPPPDLVSGPTPGGSGKLIASESLGGEPHAVMISHGPHCRPNFAPVTVPQDAYFLRSGHGCGGVGRSGAQLPPALEAFLPRVALRIESCRPPTHPKLTTKTPRPPRIHEAIEKLRTTSWIGVRERLVVR
jgi:signal peptidase I